VNLNFGAASKYRNKKVEVDGYTFDSKKEAATYLELKACKASGEIVNFEMQKRFELIPAQFEDTLVNGKRKTRCVERAITYLADFVVYYPDGEVVVLDCKGFKMEVYRIKKKLMYMVHKIKIKEV
jgi:hypothetical protein